MENSKLVRLMKTLSANELNEFKRYVYTDFFNRKDRLRKLCKRLAEYAKGKEVSLNRLDLHRFLFPEERAKISSLSADAGQALARKRIDHVFNELKSLLEDFLVMKQSREPGFDRDMLLMKALTKRKADNAFFEHARKVESKLTARKHNIRIHLDLYRFHQFVYEHPANHRVGREKEGMVAMGYHLDVFYLISKLSNGWVQLLANSMYNQVTETPMLEAAIEHAGKAPFKDLLLVEFFRKIVLDIQQNTVSGKGLKALRAMVTPIFDKLDVQDQFGVFHTLLTYSSVVGMVYENSYAPEEFAIMKWGLEKGFILRNGRIRYADFLNITRIGLLLGEIDWVADFVEDYQSLLKPELRRPTSLMAKARIEIARQNFKEALRLLQEKEVFTNNMDKLLVRLMRMKCYYDLGETDLLEHALDASRKNAGRSQEYGARLVKHYRGFINALRDLHFKAQDEHAIRELLKKLEQKKVALSQEWLLEKAKALLEKFN